jgi:hypothetical protein
MVKQASQFDCRAIMAGGLAGGESFVRHPLHLRIEFKRHDSVQTLPAPGSSELDPVMNRNESFARISHMHNNSPAQDFGLGLVLCACIVIIFIAAIIFYGTVLLTLACIVSTAIWVTTILWNAGKDVPQFRDEVLVLGGIAIASSLFIAAGLGSWALELNWSHRPILLTFGHYSQFFAFNGSLVALMLRARARGLDQDVLAPLSATVSKMAVRSAFGFTLLGVLATKATLLHEGILFTSCLLPLVFVKVSTPSILSPRIQDAN